MQAVFYKKSDIFVRVRMRTGYAVGKLSCLKGLTMYQITAVFNRHCLNDVLRELFDNAIEGVTVTDVIGKGSLGIAEKNNAPDLYPKVMLFIVVSNEKVKEVTMEAIRAHTQDLGHGAGKMWVTPVLEVERIRTGEKNSSALTQPIPRAMAKTDTFFTAVDTPSS
jgi:nitrogen regulatory protein P-II 1